MYNSPKILLAFLYLLAMACNHKEEPTEDETPAEVQTPVTVTTISHAPLTEYIELNATASYLQSNFIKAPVSGYLTSVSLQMGQHVSAGQTAFSLKTKEAQALGNTINVLDSSFRFTGMINIRSQVSGYVQELNHRPGDYVQEGEQLASVSDASNFGFMLNVPYELQALVKPGQSFDISLPDGTKLIGTAASYFPSMDSVSQTQSVLLRVKNNIPLPQNLIAKVRILRENKTSVVSIPREALLTDESQTDFWVMKMIGQEMAVKVPVTKGFETGGMVEIISPVFSDSDKILLTGQYGLPDTARVKIITAGQ